MSQSALRGCRILVLAINLPGPVAAARLRDLGAQVTRIEPPVGDPLALASPAWYRRLGAGTTIRRLDLKSPAGQTFLTEQLPTTDLLLTSYRPAALARLGLAWPALAERYPSLCQVAIVGHPPPDENRPGHDLTYQAAAGLVQPPDLPRTLVADMAGATAAVVAALALLLTRHRSGPLAPADRYETVALAKVAHDLAAPLREGLTGPDRLLGGGLPGYNLYRAADGWVALAALEPVFWERVQEALGESDLTVKALAALLASRPVAHWSAWAREADIPLHVIADSMPANPSM